MRDDTQPADGHRTQHGVAWPRTPDRLLADAQAIRGLLDGAASNGNGHGVAGLLRARLELRSEAAAQWRAAGHRAITDEGGPRRGNAWSHTPVVATLGDGGRPTRTLSRWLAVWVIGTMYAVWSLAAAVLPSFAPGGCALGCGSLGEAVGLTVASVTMTWLLARARRRRARAGDAPIVELRADGTIAVAMFGPRPTVLRPDTRIRVGPIRDWSWRRVDELGPRLRHGHRGFTIEGVGSVRGEERQVTLHLGDRHLPDIEHAHRVVSERLGD